MGLSVSAVKNGIRYCEKTIKGKYKHLKKIPKEIKTAYRSGGTKNVLKTIGPATSSLTVLGTFSPIPFGSVLGFGTGRIIDKALKYLKILK